MLRVTFKNDPSGAVVMRLEGRLVEKFAEVAKAAAGRKPPRNLIVDLSDVTYVDSSGEELLRWLRRMGGEFRAESLYSRSVCEYLGLPLVGEHVGSIPGRKI
jgi:anti-anti-sigma regulatory factor